MKLRIKGNSLRLRLSQGEVKRLATEGQVTETMQLPQSALGYRLLSNEDVTRLGARMEQSVLTVIMPAEQMRRWTGTDEVSVRGQDGPLHILVEKDFACLKPRDGEDDSDAFPNPDATNG